MTWSEVPKPILPAGFPTTAYMMFTLGADLVKATKNGDDIHFGAPQSDLKIRSMTLDDMKELLGE